ncbi:MAG: protein kinase, partial [Myxococcales bacterium]|nr:protein kinase [Myxococcales bacterium]
AGFTIGARYIIEEQIGSGGMGTVYRARTMTDDGYVAIKFLDQMLARSAHNRARFLREAKAANKIDHEHIIDIMNYGEGEDGLVYLVMEYLEGVPLNEEIAAKGAFSVERALDIALQMAQALARAHELDVVHRDIKPENIFLLQAERGDFVKVLDFGLAQMKGELKLTMTGAVFGTPEYMAPEQCLGKQATHSVDLYALGAVVFEMLVGLPPYGGSIPDMLEAHIKSPVPVPVERRRGIPPEVDRLVARLMAKEPGARLRDAHHVIEEIQSILGGEARTRKRSVLQIQSRPNSKTVDVENAWGTRIQEFETWLAKAHPAGDGPEWIRREVEAMRAQMEEVDGIRRELDRINQRMDEREKEVRETRLRIGRALDELGRDESRLVRDMDASTSRLDAARERLLAAEKPLKDTWATVPGVPDTMPHPTVVETLRELGHLASIWIEAQRAVASLAREAETRVREREDMQYQITQLKERFDNVSEGSDGEIDELKKSTATLDQTRRQYLDELTQRAEGVYRYFMAIPGFRSLIGVGQRAAN